jgi:uncharacterized protein YndB with AHSA1/START domain
MNLDTASFRTSRKLLCSPERVYSAFAVAEQLATWWGPDGFRNEFEHFDFRPGGAWKFVMIGPDGSRHSNENRFVELVQGSRVVIHHESAPRFILTIDIAPAVDGALLTWTQAFEDPAVAAAVRHIVEPANEQNLNRLSALLAGDQGAASTSKPANV